MECPDSVLVENGFASVGARKLPLQQRGRQTATAPVRQSPEVLAAPPAPTAPQAA
jgi:hypothetical protein